jgi:hypothetical protein
MRLPRSQGDRAVIVAVSLLALYLLWRWLH